LNLRRVSLIIDPLVFQSYEESTVRGVQAFVRADEEPVSACQVSQSPPCGFLPFTKKIKRFCRIISFRPEIQNKIDSQRSETIHRSIG
jgi:hypothetical protein